MIWMFYTLYLECQTQSWRARGPPEEEPVLSQNASNLTMLFIVGQNASGLIGRGFFSYFGIANVLYPISKSWEMPFSEGVSNSHASEVWFGSRLMKKVLLS